MNLIIVTHRRLLLILLRTVFPTLQDFTIRTTVSKIDYFNVLTILNWHMLSQETEVRSMRVQTPKLRNWSKIL